MSGNDFSQMAQHIETVEKVVRESTATVAVGSIADALNNINQTLGSMAKENIWYKDPQWWAVIIALLLGVVGIFQDWIRGLFKKPKLVPSISMKSPDCHLIPLTNRATGEFMYNTYYLRFLVSNKGDNQLENVEVMATELWKKDGDNYVKQESFLPLNLVWAHQGLVTMPTIQPGTFKHCDFGHVLDKVHMYSATSEELKQKLAGTNDVYMELDCPVRPNTWSHIIKPGEYKIKIVFAASNSKPVPKIYSLQLKNAWTNNEQEMLTQNILVKEIVS